MRKITGILAALGAAAALAVSAGPALASPYAPAMAPAHAPFAVVDNGGVLVTRQPLVTGQVIYSGGIAYTVVWVHGVEFGIVPGLPVSDWGRRVVFST